MPHTDRDALLIGRDRELARLANWVSDVVSGRGRAVLVEGEPGIGKSALVRAACRQATQSGCEVFWGSGDELGQELPLLPLLDGLRVRESADDPRRQAIVRLLRGEVIAGSGVDLSTAAAEHLLELVGQVCATAPVVLVVDDLQWADHATVGLWGRLARSIRERPLLLIGMARAVPHPDSVLALRRAVGRAGVLRLGPLADTASSELLATLAGGTPGARLLQLAHGAAGNPLYLTELVDTLARGTRLATSDSGTVEVTDGPVPDTLSAAIADRLGFLSGRVREVLRAAALLGVDFSVSDLAVLLKRGITELLSLLDESRAVGVLVDGDGGLSFRHPLIRSALYQEMPAAVRSAWHRDAGRALAEAGAPVERVARQLLSATDGANDTLDQWMAGWLVDAAPVLSGRAPAAAGVLFRRALLGTPSGGYRHALLASRLADALYRVGDLPEAERVAAEAVAHVADPDVLVDLHWTLAQCRARLGQSAESLVDLNRALTAPGVAPRHRARLLVLIARMHRALGEVDLAGQVAGGALDAATEADDRWASSWALHVLSIIAIMRGDVAEALPLFDRALAATAGDPALTDLRMLLQINKAVALGDLDRYDEAIAVAQDVRDLADRTGGVVRLTQAQSALAELLFDTGRWDEALAEIAVAPADLKDPPVACCDHGIAAVISFHRGDAAAARSHLDRAAPHADRIGNRVVGSLALARSVALEQADDATGALAALTGGLGAEAEELEEMEDLFPDAVRLAVELGDTATAAAVTCRAETLAGAAVPHRIAAGLYCRGVFGRDPALLRRAAKEYEAAGRPLARAKALEAAALAAAESGDSVAARDAFTQAFDVYTDLDAHWDTGRLKARFRGLGIRRGPHAKHRQARHGWDSLTPTESRIAALVVEGMSNPQVAAELFLSPRTVATHVSHILAKLGVQSRIDIAREAGRRAANGS